MCVCARVCVLPEGLTPFLMRTAVAWYNCLCVLVRVCRACWNESFPERLLWNRAVALMTPSNLLRWDSTSQAAIHSLRAPACSDIAASPERSTVQQLCQSHIADDGHERCAAAGSHLHCTETPIGGRVFFVFTQHQRGRRQAVCENGFCSSSQSAVVTLRFLLPLSQTCLVSSQR